MPLFRVKRRVQAISSRQAWSVVPSATRGEPATTERHGVAQETRGQVAAFVLLDLERVSAQTRQHAQKALP
jgi:hypothetical protein